MPRNVWNDIVSWQTRRLNNSTKYLLHASLTIISKRKNWKLKENCQKYPLKLFWNACTWHALDDLIFSHQWTNLHDRLRNGPMPVTNAKIVWYLTSITHVKTNSIVMLVILLNNAGCDCFKTPLLREILRTQNPLRVEHCAFLEVIHLCQKLDVQETNFSFTQLNRSRNHFFGCRIEVRWFSCSWSKGSDRFSFWEHELEPYRRGRPVVEQTWSLFSTSHDSQTQAISESDQWFG